MIGGVTLVWQPGVPPLHPTPTPDRLLVQRTRHPPSFPRQSRMTIPTRGRRFVRVGDVDYVWRIRKKPTYLQGAFHSSMTLAVQPYGVDARNVLVVNLRISRPDNWISPHQTAVTPSTVREMIVGALAIGWQPFNAAAPFFYEHPLIRDRA